MRTAVLTTVLVVVVSACGGATPQATTTEAETTTTTAAPTTTTEADRLPEGWARCENQVHGYSVGHPGDWSTGSLGAETECRWFDPEPFQVEEATEGPIVALEVRSERVAFDEVGSRVPESARVVLEEETTTAGHPALRLEYLYEEPGPMLPEGTRVYEYRIDRDGELFLVQTVALPEVDDDTYRGHKQVVDQATETLRFEG